MSAKHFVNKVVAKMTVSSAWPFPNQGLLGITPVVKWPELVIPSSGKVNITHCMGENGKGGVTLAWRKASDTKNARMVEVSVAYCSPADTFTKKVGKELALESFYNGETVMVPARTDKNDDTIPHNLRNMFWYAFQD